MKRLVFVSLFVLAAFYFTGCSSSGSNDNSGGGGGDSDFILISDASGLNNIRDNLSGKYRLDDDIDLSVLYNSGWTPIGGELEPFTGVLDGNGYKIEGLYVAGVDSAGLFGYIGEGAEVKNLTIEISSNNVIGTKYAGALAGIVEGAEDNEVIISEVTIAGTGEVQANTPDYKSIYAGGLVGVLSYADLSDCVNGADVSSDLQGYEVYSGGIAGYAVESKISGSYNTGDISAAFTVFNAYMGGIAGETDNSEIANTYNTGGISGTVNPSSPLPGEEPLSFAGGIAGRAYDDSKIINSYNRGNISLPTSFSYTYNYAGGIAGVVFWESEIRDNAAINGAILADTTGTTEIGRVLGVIDDFMGANTISNNFANSGMKLNGYAVADDDENGTGITLTDFQSRAIYETDMGWEFGNGGNPVWKMPEDEMYPILHWQK